jgi:phosphatidylinositol glycan class B
MKFKPVLSLNYLLLIYLVLHLVAPFFSIGAYHPDEHFQILEFMHARLGFSSLSDLPWEYQEKMRSWWIPFLLSPIEWTGRSLFKISPFHLEYLYRVVASLFSGTALVYYIRRYYQEYSAPANKSLFYILLTLWFLPFLHARLSPEVLGTSLFILTLGFFSTGDRDQDNASLRNNLVLGILFAILFFIRFHFSFFIFGWFMHRLFIQKNRKISSIIVLASGFIVGCLLSIMVDYWGYGSLTLSPYNYFYQNVIMAKASNFGVTPWWDYFSQILAKGPGPLGILYIASFLIFFITNYKSQIAWMTAPFFLTHLLTGHKELRFLFPLVPFLIIAIFQLTLLLNYPYSNSRLKILLVKTYFALNLLLLLPATLFAVQKDLSFLKYFSKLTERPEKIFLSSGENPFRLADLKYSYYGNFDIKTSTISSLDPVFDESSLQGIGPVGLYLDRYWKCEIVSKWDRCKLMYYSPMGFFYQYLPEKIRKKSRYSSYWHCQPAHLGEPVQ